MPGKPFSIPRADAHGCADHGDVRRAAAPAAAASDLCDLAARLGGGDRYAALAEPDLDLVTGWRRCRGQSAWDRRRQRRLRRIARRH